ncbi:MAG: hypothetical protein RSE13_25150 [Planktothrix sp. GU0601_MAG3]|nr:MAG: hypothetical protein RSE13_25150 [Planktothrix sp. GU0601_MAG3]
MDIFFSSIPSIPDLTHPNELMELGSIVIKNLMKLAIFLIAIGGILSLINWSVKKPGDSISIPAIKTALEQYLKWMQTLPHLILIVSGNYQWIFSLFYLS